LPSVLFLNISPEEKPEKAADDEHSCAETELFPVERHITDCDAPGDSNASNSKAQQIADAGGKNAQSMRETI
jgi:hypothetical protein